MGSQAKRAIRVWYDSHKAHTDGQLLTGNDETPKQDASVKSNIASRIVQRPPTDVTKGAQKPQFTLLPSRIEESRVFFQK
ncbi:hypothetical protein X801_06379 [Opisthorchis viverrini]|uniref:Uncharacterized protein n=1 Tax=Opisthorchis viverrini TaxID=6198 RepID=A0A1S8WTN5_OPIVI|nr:hypothetical protein X801_06379 [Opisthorchis viverrini]